jgi:hypothetical protein
MDDATNRIWPVERRPYPHSNPEAVMHILTDRSRHMTVARRLVAGFAALAAGGCTDLPTHPIPVPVTPASRELVDGNHGGNAHFFFLPPVGPLPRFSGTFDPTQAPTVVVCELRSVGLGCTSALPPVIVLGVPSARSDEQVRVVGERYVTAWRTARSSLSPAKIYRIGVQVAGLELGHVDVTPVVSLGGLRNAITGDLIPFLPGMVLPIEFRIEQGALLFKGAIAAEVTGRPEMPFLAGSPDGSLLTTFASSDGAHLSGASLRLPTGATVSVLFDEQGRPARAMIGSAVFVFGNYSGSTVDVAAIAPDGSITIARGIPVPQRPAGATLPGTLAGTAVASRSPAPIVVALALPSVADLQSWLAAASWGVSAAGCVIGTMSLPASFGVTTVLVATTCSNALAQLLAHALGQDSPELQASAQAFGSIAAAIGCIGAPSWTSCRELLLDAIKNNWEFEKSVLDAAAPYVLQAVQQLMPGPIFYPPKPPAYVRSYSLSTQPLNVCGGGWVGGDITFIVTHVPVSAGDMYSGTWLMHLSYNPAAPDATGKCVTGPTVAQQATGLWSEGFASPSPLDAYYRQISYNGFLWQ